jgi:uncharacterized phiE125 gp8 family phage protein
MPLKLKTAAAVRVVTLEDAKAHSRVDFADDDAWFNTAILAVEDFMNGNAGVLGRAMVTQEWELYLDGFPLCDRIDIHLGPMQSVSAVEYRDATTGNYVLWPSTNYVVDNVSFEGCVAASEPWPSAKDEINSVRITFLAGYGAASSDIPARLRMAVLQMISHWYQNRESVNIGNITNEVPQTFTDLIRSLSKISI